MTIAREENTAAANVDAPARAFFVTAFVHKFVVDVPFYRESGPYAAIGVI